MAKHTPLTVSDVERGLKAMGFTKRPQKATSHTQWVRSTEKGILKVTVDAPKSPFSHDLIKSMAHQAGVSVSGFYEVCSKDGAKKAKRGLLGWLLSD